MAWYFIVLLVMAYFIIGTVMAGLLGRISYDYKDGDIILWIVITWPITGTLILFCELCRYIYEMIVG
jgi:hypothetical protein